MKYIIRKLFAYILNYIKKTNWKEIIYKLYTEKIREDLKAFVEKTDNKVDDTIFAGIDRFIEVFFGPEA